jgi:hypothetical protein
MIITPIQTPNYDRIPKIIIPWQRLPSGCLRGWRKQIRWQFATRVQVWTVDSTMTAGGTIAVAFPSNVTIGNLLFAYIRINVNTATTPTGTDTQSNTWTYITNTELGESVNNNSFACLDSIVTTGGADTLTITWAAGASNPVRVIACEWSGVTASPRDQVKSTLGAASVNADSGATGTLAQASELVIGCCGGSGAGGTFVSKSGSGYTDRETVATRIFMQDQIVSATTAMHALITLSVSQIWAAHCVTYKLSAAAAQPFIGATIKLNTFAAPIIVRGGQRMRSYGNHQGSDSLCCGWRRNSSSRENIRGCSSGARGDDHTLKQ